MGETQSIWDGLISSVTREITPVATGLGYGSDLSCELDCDAAFSELSSDSLEMIAQAIFRRLITPRGALLDDPDYGLDLRAYLNASLNAAETAALRNGIVSEIAKDDRVAAVRVDVALSLTTSTLTVEINVLPEGADKAFDMVAVVSSTTAFLKGFE